MPVLTLDQQRDAALQQVRLHAEPTAFPVVTDEDVGRILDSCLQASIWSPETDYEVDDLVVPTSRNRHCYRCVQNGESATTEPTWPLVQGSQVYDGADDTVIIWQEDGPDTTRMFHQNLYHWGNAIRLIWLKKAEMVSNLHDTRRSQSSSEKSQLRDQFLKNAKGWEPIKIR